MGPTQNQCAERTTGQSGRVGPHNLVVQLFGGLSAGLDSLVSWDRTIWWWKSGCLIAGASVDQTVSSSGQDNGQSDQTVWLTVWLVALEG
jgi:hypothetical protein